MSDADLTAKIGSIVSDVRASFISGRTRPLVWRLSQLDALLELLEVGEDRLLAALADDLGKPAFEAWTADLGTTAAEIRHMRKHLPGWMAPRKAKLSMLTRPGRAEIVAEPLGVALIIAPWNYPVQLLLEPLAAALAAGNAAVVKPSELAPATSAVLADLIAAHLDSEAVACVEGGVETSTALLEQRFDHIFFTGSTRIGRVVMTAAAQHLTPVTLELGGKSPAIVDIGADIEIAARRLTWGKFLNCGQTCIAPDYVLAHREIRDELVDAMASEVRNFYGFDPLSSPDYGRIVNHSHFRRLVDLLEGPGAGQVAVGGTYRVDGLAISPTVLVDPDPDAAVMQEEIFGPILPVLAVDSVADAIDFVNARPKPLALYVFAHDKTLIDDVVTKTSSGGVCVNHTVIHITPPDLPFGGVGPSGIGRYHGKSGFETFSNLKPVLHKPPRPDPKIIYPPYNKLKDRLVRKVL